MRESSSYISFKWNFCRIEVRRVWEADERSCLSNLHRPFTGKKSSILFRKIHHMRCYSRKRRIENTHCTIEFCYGSYRFKFPARVRKPSNVEFASTLFLSVLIDLYIFLMAWGRSRVVIYGVSSWICSRGLHALY